MKILKLTALFLLAAILLITAACGPTEQPPTDPGYNDNVRPVETETETETERITEAPKHTVTFDYNDGSGRKTTIEIPEGGNIAHYAPYPLEGVREVTAWSAAPEGMAYMVPVTESITLYAQWITHELVVYTDNIPDTINDAFVEIRPASDAQALSGRVLRIGANVKSIALVSDGTVYDKFAILINERTTDLSMAMENFSYKSNRAFGLSGSGGSEVGYRLSLQILGHVSIDCAVYSTAGTERAADCINVSSLSLSGTGTLTLLAGHGLDGSSRGNAGNGQDGERGGDGTHGGFGIITNALELENLTLNISAGNGGHGGQGGGGNLSGSKGGHGGDGGRGGNGGNAIYTKTFKASAAMLTLQGGRGGNGGNGGNGGGGGLLGLGTYQPGGDGGNGGNGGSVFANMLDASDTRGLVTTLTPGLAGQAGSGGSSGAAGGLLDGDAGTPGRDGSTNLPS